jgi:hypothetical protein
VPDIFSCGWTEESKVVSLHSLWSRIFMIDFDHPAESRISSLIAIPFVGTILKWNLRLDVERKELPDVLRKVRSD